MNYSILNDPEEHYRLVTYALNLSGLQYSYPGRWGYVELEHFNLSTAPEYYVQGVAEEEESRRNGGPDDALSELGLTESNMPVGRARRDGSGRDPIGFNFELWADV